jgi:AAA+ ATPase superfamily predicted ATPase
MIEPEKPIENPDEFYGRAAIVRRIFSRVGAARPQSIAVIGGRKIGKTSLLNFIFHDSTRKKYLDNRESFIFLKVNLRDEKFKDAESFLHTVYRQLALDKSGDGNLYNALQKFVEDSHKAGKKIIILLDDFHYITRNQNFPLEFFSFLRSLANNYNLAYVTSSYLELQKLCIAKDIEESPFFNIFTNIALGLLSPEEAAELCLKLSSVSREQAEKLVAWCGPLAYGLKIALKKIGNQDAIGENEYEKLLMPELTGYFEEVVSILTKEALKPLKELAKGKEPDPKDIHQLRPLIRQSFLLEDAEKLDFYSPAFKLFILKYFSASLLKGSDSCS